MPWRKMRFFDKDWISGDLDDDEFEKRIFGRGKSVKTAANESQKYKYANPEQAANISKETAKKYDQKIKWGINTINVRKEGKGFWGERMSQHNIRVDKYELKINPNNESFYLPHPMGGFVQFENLKNKTVQDGKLILEVSLEIGLVVA